jgi:hypothetical protein
MFPQLKVNNSIPTPRPKWVSTILLILVLMAVACGRQQTRKIYTPSLTGIPIPTESIAEPAQAMSQQEITPELPSPTETPLVNTTSMSGGIAFHQPAVQTFNGQRPFKIGLLTGMQDPFSRRIGAPLSKYYCWMLYWLAETWMHCSLHL